MTASEPSYVVASRSPWFWDNWSRNPPPPGTWHYIEDLEGLRPQQLVDWSPRFVFLPHWSERIPETIWSKHECVVFHAAPVPYGRGGSPIQNMVLSGHDTTEVVALRAAEGLDTGPVYLRRDVSLLGGGDEVFIRVFALVDKMIREIVSTEPRPAPQEGAAHHFDRRTPEQSELPESGDLAAAFDHIRILDTEGYPRAFINYGRFRVEFSRPALRRGQIAVDAVIRLDSQEEEV